MKINFSNRSSSYGDSCISDLALAVDKFGLDNSGSEPAFDHLFADFIDEYKLRPKFQKFLQKFFDELKKEMDGEI